MKPPCRLCGALLDTTLVDLGSMPLANSFLSEAQLAIAEPRYPLHARVCGACLLVQVEAAVRPEAIFDDYAYFSSYSSSWVEHARRFAGEAAGRLALGPGSMVVEAASNDGYLLKHFLAMGIPCLGIEPAANVAAAAVAAGVPTEVFFLGRATAEALSRRGVAADLLVANNVLAHVPDLDDFVAGLKTLLRPSGVLSVEFPHVLELLRQVEFDTIYHEHLSYLSLGVVERLFRRHGLAVFDVERLSTHGGSLRLWAAPRARGEEPGLLAVRAAEREAGLERLDAYRGFADKVAGVCRGLVGFLDEARREGRRVAAYGAAAKGNTLLNACRVGPERIAFVCDRNVHKQRLFTPGSHIPIRAPEAVFEARPDYLLILAWNLKDEIMRDMAAVRRWGCRFVVPIPRVEVLA